MASNTGSKLPLVALCFFLLLIQLTYAARSVVSSTKYAEVQEQLKRLNKPPIKSIQSPDGDIIDCVTTTHQPAFDEPLLKNHVFQMRPSSEPEGYEHNEESVVQIWHDAKEECPDGTIAIRRVKEEDLLRASSVREYGRKKHRSVPQLNTTDDLSLPATTSVHEYAIVGVRGNTYHGTQTSVSLWQPSVQANANEFSLAQLWLVSGTYGPQNDLNTIEVGWQIYPQLYRDTKTRLFVYWTRDAYMKTGCYNLLCSGFVQTSKTVVVGATLSPVSVYGGTQNNIIIHVWKDKSSGNWWLKIGTETVGYWPSSLFTKLRNGATDVQWGGEIVNENTGGQHTTTDMGSGHFSNEGSGKAGLFKNVKTIDTTDTLTNVNAFSYNIITNANCYDLKSGKSAADGSFFYYGGPGRNPSCP